MILLAVLHVLGLLGAPAPALLAAGAGPRVCRGELHLDVECELKRRGGAGADEIVGCAAAEDAFHDRRVILLRRQAVGDDGDGRILGEGQLDRLPFALVESQRERGVVVLLFDLLPAEGDLEGDAEVRHHNAEIHRLARRDADGHVVADRERAPAPVGALDAELQAGTLVADPLKACALFFYEAHIPAPCSSTPATCGIYESSITYYGLF